MMAKPNHKPRRSRFRRPDRRRAGWRPALDLAPLEGRAMLSVAAAVAPLDLGQATGPTAAVVGPQPYQAPVASTSSSNPPSAPVGVAPGAPTGGSWMANPAHLLRRFGPGPEGAGAGPGSDGGGGAFGGAFGGPAGVAGAQGRVILAEDIVNVGGVPTREVAIADQDGGSISVAIGSRTLTYSASVDHPEALAMRDLNGDGVPDLVVANSGGPDGVGSVLIFLGVAGGGFGATPQSFDGGDDPGGITVGDVDGRVDASGRPTLDLVVADRGSDQVRFLMGQGQGADWTMTGGGSIPLPARSDPIGTALVDVNHDGSPDLFVCNSGTGEVMLFDGLGDGRFDTSSPRTFAVGTDPDAMFVGRFDRRPGLDLVTLNAGSNDLSFVSGVFGASPTTTSLGSGGLRPDAAFAVDLGQGGAMSLVVANGGDGRVALLQPGPEGMQLAGVISQPELPSVTALAPGGASSDGLDLFAATAGLDAAAILHFDLGTTSVFLAVPASGSSTSEADADLVAQLTPIGESPLDLVAILGNGEGEGEDAGGEAGLRSLLSGRFYARSEVQGADPGSPVNATSGDPGDPDRGPNPDLDRPADPSPTTRFVLGFGDDGEPERARAKGGPWDGPVGALASRDLAEIRDDRGDFGLARLGPEPGDAEARSDAVDEALRSLLSDGEIDGRTEPGQAGAGPRPDPTPARQPTLDDPRPPEVASGAVPVVSSALIAARLIFRGSTPRPPSFRRGPRRPSPIAPPSSD